MAAEENFVTQIRLKSIEETNANRIMKRSSLHNAKRMDYERVAKMTTLPNLEDFKKLCGYFVRDKKLKDLQRIHKGLASGQQYIDAFMGTTGTMYTLVGCLSGINTKLHLESLYCVINIGLGTESQCLKMCQRGGSYLVSCLSGINTQVQVLCSWAFGNLCGSHPSVCTLLLSQGFEEVVVNALSSHSQAVTRWSSYALNHYLNTVPQRIGVICQPEVLKSLLHCASTTDEEEIGDTCWCLFVASTEPSLCRCLANLGVVSAAHNILTEAVQKEALDVRTVTVLVRLLTNCVAVLHELAVEICYRADDFSRIVKCLLRSPYLHLQRETLQLVANLMGAANKNSITGEKVLEDSNLKKMLEPDLKLLLMTSVFEPSATNFQFSELQKG